MRNQWSSLPTQHFGQPDQSVGLAASIAMGGQPALRARVASHCPCACVIASPIKNPSMHNAASHRYAVALVTALKQLPVHRRTFVIRAPKRPPAARPCSLELCLREEHVSPHAWIILHELELHRQLLGVLLLRVCVRPCAEVLVSAKARGVPPAGTAGKAPASGVALQRHGVRNDQA